VLRFLLIMASMILALPFLWLVLAGYYVNQCSEMEKWRFPARWEPLPKERDCYIWIRGDGAVMIDRPKESPNE